MSEITNNIFIIVLVTPFPQHIFLLIILHASYMWKHDQNSFKMRAAKENLLKLAGPDLSLPTDHQLFLLRFLKEISFVIHCL